MIKLAEIVKEYRDRVYEQCGFSLKEEHISAMNAILRCRTIENGEMLYSCPDCGEKKWIPHSCGNRNCPQCQNDITTAWLDKQRNKLLPTEYFMVTFTIPHLLRNTAKLHSKLFYNLMFTASSEAMKEIASEKRCLGGEIGMTGVLHTNSRKLDYHPHIHYVVPSGGIVSGKKIWKNKKSSYLMPEKPLSMLFRGKLIALLKENKIPLPVGLYENDWVIDITYVGRGDPALQYLSRYIYRGVMSEKRIIKNENGSVTFSYTDSESNETKTRTLPGQKFLFLILTHVLPKGFRRCRDYGFLHGNRGKTLRLIQLICKVRLQDRLEKKEKPQCKCSHCKKPMLLTLVKVFRTLSLIPSRASPC